MQIIFVDKYVLTQVDQHNIVNGKKYLTYAEKIDMAAYANVDTSLVLLNMASITWKFVNMV